MCYNLKLLRTSMIRIVVAHQTRLIANIIAAVLEEEADFVVVGRTSTVEEAEHLVRVSGCDLLLVSARLPNGGALQLTHDLAGHNDTKVLVIGVPDSEQIILQYATAGADGYVLQDVTVERLLANIRAAMADRAIVSPDVAGALMRHVAELAQVSRQSALDPGLLETLTPREREVLDLIAENLTNQQIGERLVIEVGTVKNHVHNILKKLDVSSRGAAAALLPFLPDDA